jgi:Na+-transporting NADH:ubiquinone oxidoreductase subunit C
MKDKPFYPVVYMFIITAFFSSIVIGVARFTQDRVDANKQIAFERAVLQACDQLADRSAVAIHETFLQIIRQADGDGYQVLGEDGQVAGFVIPVEGKGFWATIKGVIGVERDKRTIVGISFYEQNETPGLGGRITEDEFRGQFAGKHLGDGDKAIEIVPVSVELANGQVHAITGATQTCSRLEKLINDSIGQWRVRWGSENE